jgi:hypothetical protein
MLACTFNKFVEAFGRLLRIHGLRTEIEPANVIRVSELEGSFADKELAHVCLLVGILKKLSGFRVDANTKVTPHIVALLGWAEAVHEGLKAGNRSRQLRKFNTGVGFILASEAVKTRFGRIYEFFFHKKCVFL